MSSRCCCGYVLIAWACVACATPPPPAVATATTADTELRDYQLRALETRIQRMPDGPERDYFSGMLAARSGRFADAIAQLDRALPHLRESQPTRAAMALEAIATAYRADNQYGDAALARILSGTPPQTITWHGPVKLKTANSPIGSRVAELECFLIRARTSRWSAGRLRSASA